MVNLATMIIKNLIHYKKRYTGVFVSVVISAGIITGALIVGDSIRYSLKQITRRRLGRTDYAAAGRERFVRERLADDLADHFMVPVVPVIHQQGVAIADGGRMRVNRLNIYGIDDRFGHLVSGAAFDDLNDDEALINYKLAQKLGLSVNDTILVRMEYAGFIPLDSPFVKKEDYTNTLRLRVKAVVTKETAGDFNLSVNQITPYNVFVSLDRLQNTLNMEERINTLLFVNEGGKHDITAVNERIQAFWSFEDSGLDLVVNEREEYVELRSGRIFMDERVVRAISDVAPEISPEPRHIMTYFVNTLTAHNRMTPYSFVTAMTGVPGMEHLSDNGIMINQWLRDDLGVKPGDKLDLAYYSINERRVLEEHTASFYVQGLIPDDLWGYNRELMPDYPGFKDAGGCSEWDPGLSIDLDMIRDKDEDYWDDYRGTPKAVITMAAAKRLWDNQFGSLTAVRYPYEPGPAYPTLNAFHRDLYRRLNEHAASELVDLSFSPVKSDGLYAGEHAVDFGGLFIGLSFFLIIASMLLTGLFFAFHVESRMSEIGTLLSMGFTPGRIRLIFLSEGLLVAAGASVLGGAAGIGYTHLIVYLLSTIWHQAVGTSNLVINVKVATVALGCMSGLITGIGAVLISLMRVMKKRVVSLHRGHGHTPGLRKKGRTGIMATDWWWLLSLSGFIFLLSLVLLKREEYNAGIFFGIGFFALNCGLSMTNMILKRKPDVLLTSLPLIGLRNLMTKRTRSLTTIALLASGIFLVVAVLANHHSINKEYTNTQSGTGGYALFGQTSIALPVPLTDHAAYGLDDEIEGVDFVHLRVRDGDDASCLNLHQVKHPQIVAVDPAVFADRWAFTFTRVLDNETGTNPWLLLNDHEEEGVIPAIADQSVIDWILKLKVGDGISYIDDHGNPVTLKLVAGIANSLFQGNVIIAEELFLKHFSSGGGSKLFLGDVPAGTDDAQLARYMEHLSRRLVDYGVDVEPTYSRLAAFMVIENTYLSIFLILGGLGVVLGSIGLGVLIMRNARERIRETAYLKAVGYTFRALLAIFLWEYIPLIVIGMLIGTLSGLTAIFPLLSSPGSHVPVGAISGILILLLVNSVMWAVGASVRVLRRDVSSALRDE